MPLYPFLLLGAIFIVVLILPPLVAAYIDHLRESRRGAAPRQGHVADRPRKRAD